MKLNKQQLNNLLIFLNRVNLTGQEAETLAQLKMIIVQELQKPEPLPAAKKEKQGEVK